MRSTGSWLTCPQRELLPDECFSRRQKDRSSKGRYALFIHEKLSLFVRLFRQGSEKLQANWKKIHIGTASQSCGVSVEALFGGLGPI